MSDYDTDSGGSVNSEEIPVASPITSQEAIPQARPMQALQQDAPANTPMTMQQESAMYSPYANGYTIPYYQKPIQQPYVPYPYQDPYFSPYMDHHHQMPFQGHKVNPYSPYPSGWQGNQLTPSPLMPPNTSWYTPPRQQTFTPTRVFMQTRQQTIRIRKPRTRQPRRNETEEEMVHQVPQESPLNYATPRALKAAGSGGSTQGSPNESQSFQPISHSTPDNGDNREPTPNLRVPDHSSNGVGSLLSPLSGVERLIGWKLWLSLGDP